MCDYAKISARTARTALTRLPLNSWYDINNLYTYYTYIDTDSIKCAFRLNGKKGDKMSILTTIKRRLDEVANELTDELDEPYEVSLKMFITSDEGKSEQSIGVTIIEYNTWVVNSTEINIDPNASLTETLNHVKNRFRTTSKFDQYRKSKTYTINDIIKKLEDEDDQKAWFCKKNSSICVLMLSGCFKFYRLNGKDEYTEDEYQNEIRKNLLRSTPIDFDIFNHYEEFKDYIRKFNSEITIFEHNCDSDDPFDEGDEYHFNVDNGLGCLSELDVKSFCTLFGFLNWVEIRKEMKK